MQRLKLKERLKYLAGGVMILCGLISSSTAIAQVVQRDQLILIESPGKERELIEAATVVNNELVTIVTDVAGKRRAVQKDYMINIMPILPADRADLDMDSVRATIDQYQQVIQTNPQFKQTLESRMADWQQQLVGFEKEQAEQAAKQAAQLKLLNTEADTFLARSYSITETYSAEELTETIAQARRLIPDLPDRAQAINEALSLWENHLNNLQAGNIVFDGAWITPTELKRMRQEKEQAAQTSFLSSLEFEMGTQVFSQNTIWMLLGVAALGLLLPLIILAQTAFGLIRGEALSMIQFGLSTIAVGFLLFYGYVGYRCSNDPSEITDYVEKTEGDLDAPGADQLQRALFLSSSPDSLVLTKSDTEIQLSALEINGIAQQKIKLVQNHESSPTMAERVEIYLELTNSHVKFFEQIQWGGQSLLVRYDLSHKIENNVLLFQDVDVYLGDLKLPAKLKSLLWMNLRKDLAQLFETSGITQYYQLAGVEADHLKLIMVERPMVSDDRFTEGAVSIESQDVEVVKKTTL